MKQIFSLVICWLAIAPLSRAALFERTSEANQTSLIELYTSEGCSSCPPAEDWLGHLKQEPRLWQDFVPVAFHVDYWDGLGWPDRFARKEFTARQNAYATAWKAGSVYTPGFVLDGQEWTGWRAGLPGRSADKPGVLQVKETAAGKFTVTFSPAKAEAGKWSYHMAVLGMDVSSKIKAGENRGRKLTHDFVVLSFDQQEAAANEVKFELKRPADAGGTRSALAVWVSRAGEQRPVQAVGGWWEP